MKLIADSGSTKTLWLLNGAPIETLGLNPVRDNEKQIREVVSSLPDAPVAEIYFYGAGCISPYKESIARALTVKYPDAIVSVESDMLGAARATCLHSPGIVGILGTGSNSCLYDGEEIAQNVSPLGYILGDEGSGAVLGRTLIGDALKGQLGDELRERFLQRFGLTPQSIIESVYRQPLPNRFLASLVPFLDECRHEPAVRDLLLNQFKRFFKRNIALYNSHLPVHLVGGVAFSFSELIRESAAAEGFEIGQIIKDPIQGLRAFHEEN